MRFRRQNLPKIAVPHLHAIHCEDPTGLQPFHHVRNPPLHTGAKPWMNTALRPEVTGINLSSVLPQVQVPGDSSVVHFPFILFRRAN